jgi:ketosteroid isomerase-like protein
MYYRNRCASVVSIIALVCIAGCTRGTQTPSDQSGSGAAVRAAAAAWTQAAAARNGAAMGEYFADNAFVMYPQSEPTIGRAANTAAWTAVFAEPRVRHPITADSVVVAGSGDMAYVQGRWHFTAPATGTEAAADVGGRYIAVWRPVGAGGAWRIVALSANTLNPAPDM